MLTLRDLSKRECLVVLLSFLFSMGFGGLVAKVVYATDLGSEQIIRYFGRN